MRQASFLVTAGRNQLWTVRPQLAVLLECQSWYDASTSMSRRMARYTLLLGQALARQGLYRADGRDPYAAGPRYPRAPVYALSHRASAPRRPRPGNAAAGPRPRAGDGEAAGLRDTITQTPNASPAP